MKRAASAGLLTSLVLGACSFAPDYQTPATPQPAQYREADAQALGAWTPAQPADTSKRSDWWTVFDDERLNALEAEAAQHNQSLAAALARYTQARSLAREARAALLPEVDGQGSWTRQRYSEHGLTYQPGRPQVVGDHVLRLDLSYELDVWGRVRNAANAAGAQLQASAGDFGAAQLSLQAELALNYVQLRGDDALQQMLDDTVEAYRRALQLTQNRHDGGVASAADVAQARTQYEAARAQAIAMQLERSQLQHAIAVLVGRAPEDLKLDPAPLSAEAPVIAAGLPSELLQRRPDVAAAERRVAAANAQIGVARAAWFPSFSLAALAGYESQPASGWISAPNRIWSFGPQAAFTLFDGGRRSAEVDRTRAALDEAVAGYRETVLTAYRDVEDNLAAQRLLAQQAEAQSAAVAAAQISLRQATDRYKGGVATYLEVVTAQNLLLQAQQNELNLRLRRYAAAVSLIKALGGDWRVHAVDAPVATASMD